MLEWSTWHWLLRWWDVLLRRCGNWRCSSIGWPHFHLSDNTSGRTTRSVLVDCHAEENQGCNEEETMQRSYLVSL